MSAYNSMPTPRRPMSSQVSSSLPHHDIMAQAFVNIDLMEADHEHKTGKVVQGSSDNKKESILEKKLRLSSTSPVSLALQDASRALVDFETNDAIGKALKDGLPKELEGDDYLDELPHLEVQQLQRKIAKKQQLQLDGLYAQYLRCPADDHLEQYMPRTSQTPKPSRIKTELRHTIAEKVDKAIKEARLHVFGKYCTNGELMHIMERFDEITSQGLADTGIVSKKLKKAPAVVKAADAAAQGLDGQLARLNRRDADEEVLQGIAEKIEDARKQALERRQEVQKKAKDQKAKQRRLALEKLKISKHEGKQEPKRSTCKPTNGIR